MGRFDVPEHPDIACTERTGYPWWMQESDDCEEDYDRFYEERREQELFGDY